MTTGPGRPHFPTFPHLVCAQLDRHRDFVTRSSFFQGGLFMTQFALPRLWVILIVSTAIALTTSSVWAQSQANTGSIEGVVSDPSGRPVPGASVTVLNTDTNFTRKLTTDGEGRFRAPLLPLGGYKVTVSATSFGTLVRSGMDLAVGQTINLQLTLSVAATTEVINVTADVP